MDESVGALRELLTLDELTNRVGMSVRNVRFYTTKGLVPPPIRRGRSGYYTPDHVARLELVQELQSHGFTLSAIEKYVANIPARRHPRGHRAAADDAGAVAAREPDRDDPRRARQARRPAADRRGPGHADRPRGRLPGPARPLPGRGLPALGRPGPARPRLPDRGGARRRRRVRRARAARSPRSSTRSSAPRRGRSTRSPGPPRSGSARSWSGSSRSRSPAWSRPTRAPWTRPSARASPSGRADASARLRPPVPAADATPSQVCGLPSQHQPSLGARSLIHSAGTRRSCRREPESMKHLFFSAGAARG